MNHKEVAAEKRRAQDPVGEAKRQREMQDERQEKKRKEKEAAVSFACACLGSLCSARDVLCLNQEVETSGMSVMTLCWAGGWRGAKGR